MNIRKNIDYSDMYAALDAAISAEKQQMNCTARSGRLYASGVRRGQLLRRLRIAQAIPRCARFLSAKPSSNAGFYRTYEDRPDLLTLTLQIGWTQNVVILETDLSMELREWYLRAVNQFHWLQG